MSRKKSISSLSLSSSSSLIHRSHHKILIVILLLTTTTTRTRTDLNFFTNTTNQRQRTENGGAVTFVNALLPEKMKAIERSSCQSHSSFDTKTNENTSSVLRDLWEPEAKTGPYALLHRSPRETDFMNMILLKCGCSHDNNNNNNNNSNKQRDKHKRFNEDDSAFVGCRDFLPAWFAYMKRHLEVQKKERYHRHPIIIVRNDWKNLGFGHMANVAAKWLLFGLTSGRVVFFDNAKSGWDFMDYFEGYLGDGSKGGISFKWTEELQEFYFPDIPNLSEETSSEAYDKYDKELSRFNLWKSNDANKYTQCQFGPDEENDIGTCYHNTGNARCTYDEFLKKPCFTEEELRYECPYNSREAFGCSACNKCIIHAFKKKEIILWDSSRGSGGGIPLELRGDAEMRGDVNTGNRPNLLFSNSFREALLDSAEKRFNWMYAKKFGNFYIKDDENKISSRHVRSYSPKEAYDHCLPCAMNLMLRPKMQLTAWKHLMRSDVAFARRLIGIRVRTGYAEDKNCFHDNITLTSKCIDDTFFNETCSSVELQQWHIRLRSYKYKFRNKEKEREILKPSEAVEFIKNRLDKDITPEEEYDKLSRYWFPEYLRDTSKIMIPEFNFMYVVTDAPALQKWLEKEFSDITRFSPGVGIDPTNDLRKDHATDEASRAKIAIDFKVQGWMDVSVTLSPSQYYTTADEQKFEHKKFGLDKRSGWLVSHPEEIGNRRRIGFVHPNIYRVENPEALRERIETRIEVCGADDPGVIELERFSPL